MADVSREESEPWGSQWLLTFSKRELEHEFRGQCNAGLRLFDRVWSALMFCSCVSLALQHPASAISRVAGVAQTVNALFWLIPAAMQLLLSHDQYARTRTLYHVSHYALYSFTMWIITCRGSQLANWSCTAANGVYSSVVLHPIIAFLGRQIPFRDFVVVSFATLPFWLGLLLGEGNLSDMLKVCGMPPLVSKPYQLLNKLLQAMYPQHVTKTRLEDAYMVPNGGFGFVSVALLVLNFLVVGLVLHCLERKRRECFLRFKNIGHDRLDVVVFVLEVVRIGCIVLFAIVSLLLASLSSLEQEA